MFKTEQLLVDCFKEKHLADFLKKLFDKTKITFTVIEEYDSTMNGIPDLVVGLPGLEKSVDRPPVDLNSVIYLPNIQVGADITAKSFASQYDVSLTTARKCINSFIDSGFFKTTAKGVYQKVKEYIPEFKKLIGIEAKLKNWQRALTQAYRYKHFAHCTFVVLDEHYAKPAIKAIDEFKKFNVGLISVSEKSFVIHFISKEMDPYRQGFFIRANEAVFAGLMQQKHAASVVPAF